MKLLTGKSYRIPLEDNRYLDIAVYPEKWHTTVSMDLWEKDNPSALSFQEKRYVSLEKVLPEKWARFLMKKRINRQSQQVAGISVIKEKNIKKER